MAVWTLLKVGKSLPFINFGTLTKSFKDPIGLNFCIQSCETNCLVFDLGLNDKVGGVELVV